MSGLDKLLAELFESAGERCRIGNSVASVWRDTASNKARQFLGYISAHLSRAMVQTFRHNDLAHVEELLTQHRGEYRHALIVTDGVFSMDGDLAPLAELGTLAQKHDAWLMSDDAHGLGVLANGRGAVFASGSKAPVDLQMGTLSKALGSYGGYLCASKAVIDLIKTRARTLIYSTGLPPASVAAALASERVSAQRPTVDRELRGGGNAPRNCARNCAGWFSAGADF